ncbi:MAG: hypothetical protein CM1200mP40_17750 [Gammaproteobacteria bacterium]|nr:MAG: hypothetical protein CM1200mP40_17750 [Gammaproteobacteria bacterium]
MSDQDEIQNTIQTYFNCMYESDGRRRMKFFILWLKLLATLRMDYNK